MSIRRLAKSNETTIAVAALADEKISRRLLAAFAIAILSSTFSAIDASAISYRYEKTVILDSTGDGSNFMQWPNIVAATR